MVALAQLAAAAPISTAASSTSEASLNMREGESGAQGDDAWAEERDVVQDSPRLPFLPGARTC